jgi:hypothetical protein
MVRSPVVKEDLRGIFLFAVSMHATFHLRFEKDIQEMGVNS